MPTKAALCLLSCTGGACLGLVASRVSAQTAAERSPVVTVSGVCPESSALRKVLLTLLPAPASSGPIATAAVADLGDTYVVAVGERVKRYADPARDCADRTRVAAAFIALALAPEGPSPPTATAGPPATSAPPPVAPAPEGAPPHPPASGGDVGAGTTPPEPARGWLRVDARGALEVAPESGLFAPGAALGIAAGRGAFGAHAVCGWLAQASIRLPGESGSVLLDSFPCATGPTVRLSPGVDWLELHLDAGIALGVVRASGRGFVASYESARFELGARVAVDAAVHVGEGHAGFAPIVGFEATYYPMAYTLDVAPSGPLSHTPYAWVGMTAGMCWNAK